MQQIQRNVQLIPCVISLCCRNVNVFKEVTWHLLPHVPLKCFFPVVAHRCSYCSVGNEQQPETEGNRHHAMCTDGRWSAWKLSPNTMKYMHDPPGDSSYQMLDSPVLVSKQAATPHSSKCNYILHINLLFICRILKMWSDIMTDPAT